MPPWEKYQQQPPAPAAGPWQKYGGTAAPPEEKWSEPGMIVPVQFKEGTGEARWAVPGIITDTIKAIEGPGKALQGEYGIEVDEATGRPTAITNDMIGDTMGTAGLGLTAFNPAARAAASSVGVAQRELSGRNHRLLQRELGNADIAPNQVGPRLSQVGEGAVLADLSPGLQARAAAIATTPGGGAKTIVDTLSARRAGSNSRIVSDVDNTLGPAPIPSVLAAENVASKRALSPEYQTLFRDQARAVDTSTIALDLDSMAVNLRGDAQKRAQSIRSMLNVVGTEELDPNPETLFQVRQAIDGILATEQNPQAIGTMTYIRKQVDDLLADAVPGIKEIDAQYSELARQGEAVQTGQQLLDTGRTAPRPSEVEDMMGSGALPQGAQIGPSAVPLRLRQGARAEIDRLIGTNVRDINAMKRIVAGEGNWNRDRLVSVFGQEKAEQLLNILEREAAFNATESMALAGSRTDVLRSAKADIEGAPSQPNPFRSAANFRFGDAVADTADRSLGWLFKAARENDNKQLAEALMAGVTDQQTLAALAARPNGLMQQSPLLALRASALSPEIPGNVGLGVGSLGALAGLGR